MAKDDTQGFIELSDLLRRVKRAEKAAAKANARVAAVLNAKKHYLKHRLPIRNKVQRGQKQVAKMLERLRVLLGHANIQVASASNGGSRRTLVRLSQYERVKLFALLKGNFRGVFRCSAREERALRALLAERMAS